jgi:DNA primase
MTATAHSLTPAFLDQVRDRTPLSVLIGKDIKIEKAGREHKACCPFHGEKTPSFTINDDKGFYHCFGCGAHGDAIKWLTHHRGMEFRDAVAELAAAAGMEMPQRSVAAAQRAERIEGLRPMLAAADALYQHHLSQNAAVQSYLVARGIDVDVAREFGLGYAPQAGCLRGQNLSRKAMLSAGLLGESDTQQADGRAATYERFRHRIMIPVHDRRGQIVGFGGRSMPDAAKDVAKYVNSPASEIFDKGRLLYNHHRARFAARAAQRAILVEGYLDVIALATIGIGEAVAPMGTAVTVDQLALLWRMHHMPIILLDGDKAGLKAAWRACETALPHIRPGQSLAVAILPAGADPDDVVHKTAGPCAADGARPGKAAIEAVLAAAAPLHDFMFSALAQALERDGRRDAAGNATPDAAPDAIAALWARLEALGQAITHTETRAQYLGAWRARYEREISLTIRRGQHFTGDPVYPLQTGRLVEQVNGAESYWIPDSASESERRMFQLFQYLLDKHAARDEINADIKMALTMAKAMGLSTKAINATLRDMRADQAMREDYEMNWALYRRVLGVRGPMNDAMLPNLADPRPRITSAAVKRNALVDAMIAGNV